MGNDCSLLINSNYKLMLNDKIINSSLCINFVRDFEDVYLLTDENLIKYTFKNDKSVLDLIFVKSIILNNFTKIKIQDNNIIVTNGLNEIILNKYLYFISCK